MSDIATKLTYLNTTKGKIKDSINLTGAGITTEPFRQYAVKLKDAYVDIINNGTDTLYNNFPKVSGSGTDLSLQNTYEAPMRSTLKGNTNQVQLSGKNLCGIPNQTTSVRNVSVVVQDGEITLNGTSNGDGILYLQPINTTILNGNYTTNIIYLSGGYTGSNGNFNLRNVDETIIRGSQVNLSTSNSNTSITLNEDTSVIFGIYIGNGNVFTNYKFKPQLVVGTRADYDYQEYCGGVPSPNPSYPQDIHNVSGNNDIVVCGKNLFDKDNAIDNYRITQTGIPYSDNNYYISPYIKVIPNAQYTKNSPTADAYHRYAFYEDSNTDSFIDVSSDNTITTPSNCKYIRFCGAKTEKDTTMLVVGNETPTTYEAYNGTTYPINLGSIELCKIGTYQDYIYKENDKWYLHKETIKIEVDQNSEGWITDTQPSGNPRHFIRKSTHNYDIKTPPNNDTLVEGYANVGIVSATNTAFGDKNGVAVHPNGSIYCDNGTYNNLSNIPIILEVVLNTPTNTEITDTTLLSQLEAIYNAKSKNGTTNINQENNDLPFIITASALKKD